jgi:hypothetical protein
MAEALDAPSIAQFSHPWLTAREVQSQSIFSCIELRFEGFRGWSEQYDFSKLALNEEHTEANRRIEPETMFDPAI